MGLFEEAEGGNLVRVKANLEDRISVIVQDIN